MTLVKILPNTTREQKKEEGGVYLSASQIGTFRRCKVAWAWDKLDKLPRPESSIAQAKGTRVHEILENYLKDGTPPDPGTEEGRIALAGIKYLPNPGTAEVEGEFTIEKDNIKYIGFIDFMYIKGDLPIVGDHKTSGNLSWAKTPDTLKTDVQAIIYAAYMESRHQTGVVGLNWVYYKTKTHPESLIVSLELNRDEIEKEFLGIHGTAIEMMGYHAANKKAIDLEPNNFACADFGGCKFIKHCVSKHPKWRETETNAKQTIYAIKKLKEDGIDNKQWEDKLMSKLSLKEKLALRKANKNGDVGDTDLPKSPQKEDCVKLGKKDSEIVEKELKNPALATKSLIGLMKKGAEAMEEIEYTPEKDAKTGFTLLIDCLPLCQANIITINNVVADIIDDLNKEIEGATGVLDYRLVPYNDGVKSLQVEVAKFLKENKLPCDYVLASLSSTLDRDLIDAFSKHANIVIKGIR